jgi:hypothetical protein
MARAADACDGGGSSCCCFIIPVLATVIIGLFGRNNVDLVLRRNNADKIDLLGNTNSANIDGPPTCVPPTSNINNVAT